jgi:O-methyltransferase involved in polyketide biosynthesis
MQQDDVLQSQNVQNTMLLPLWGRATVSRLYPALLRDEEAMHIVEHLPYDFSATAKSFGEYGMLTFAVRARKFDDIMRSYITRFPEASIVNIGAGMDTTFSRIDNGHIRWYDLDLPDAIAFRQTIIPERTRSRCVAKSVFDYSWFDDIDFDERKGIMFLSGGVFYYFELSDLKELISVMAGRFPGGQLIFDAESPFGLSMANHAVKKSGNGNAEMIFAVKKPSDIKAWSPRISKVTAEPYYRGLQWDKKWSVFTRIGMSLADLLRMIWIINVSFSEEVAE